MANVIADFDAIRISLASPEKIRSWSHGEVTKPETINYRTFKPERDGLFCARIFGPVTDWECLCGKYKRMKHRGVICDKCGVEVTLSKVRRERLGHIELASPCSHVWFFKGLPSRIGHLLDIPLRELEKVLYFESYIVIDPGDAPVKEKELLTDERYRELARDYPGVFVAKMGAEAIKELLMLVKVEELSVELRGRGLRGVNNRPLKSLSDTLKGKQGRFRQNLLGKRVDYSGRSVIVVGPELKLHQCGLPKKMALELFKPFIYNQLEKQGYAATIKQAREMVDRQEPVVWDILEEVIREHPVLLNRAPTLHRLGIQAFEPVLVEGKAIKIHPLVCTAFNADFDGDQMAVHIPLSPEAQIEASTLMLSSNNILSPAHGSPIAVPTQDMVLGCYYLTKARPGTKGEGRTFASSEDVLIALEMGEVETLTPIKLRYTGKVIDLVHAFDNQNMLHTEPIEFVKQYMETTVGRVILNDNLPQDMPFINGLLKKKGLAQLVQYCYLKFGLQVTVHMLDEVKNLGFLYATRAGISIGIDDMVVPSEKAALVREAEKEVVAVESQYQDGAITHGERYNKIIEIWSKVTEKVSDEMFKSMEEDDRTGRYLNPIYIMADSGARGSKQQIRQLSGMRGLMAKPSGEIIETPITANFREGLDVLQYFISTHGARKGLADTALKTADSGYLTRRLCDVAQDVIITEADCGTGDGIFVEPIVESGEIIEPLRDRIVGRVALEDQLDYEGKVIVHVNEEITEQLAVAIQAAGIERVRIRSVLTCESRRGVCQLCYGRNLATGRLVERGEAVGIISAQSIGEPGTQLTMRTFHIGGTATGSSEQSKQDAKSNGFVKFINVTNVKNAKGELIAMNRNGILAIIDEKGREKERYPVVYGAKVLFDDGAPVKANQILLEWDPYTFSILTELSGTIHFKHSHEGI